MRYCTRCLFPDTKPDIYFDELGVCDPCNSSDRKHGLVDSIDWKQREHDFNTILDRYRGKDPLNYDCLIPVSGGKDSMYQTYCMKMKHNMNPLAMTFDQFDSCERSRANLETLRSIGVDHVHFTMNPKVVRALVLKGFRVVGDPYWVNHVGIFTAPFRTAVGYRIPLIIYGENSQFEYGGPAADRDRQVFDKRWRQEFGGMRGFREEDMVDDEISTSDLKCLFFPNDIELTGAGVAGLFYGYFFKWDPVTHTEFVKQLGWKALDRPWPGSWNPSENVDMRFIDVREHLKWVKFGYGRATDQVNIYIRSKKLTRAEAVHIVRETDGRVEHVGEFCEYCGISEREFYKTRDSFVNTDLFERISETEWALKVPAH